MPADTFNTSEYSGRNHLSSEHDSQGTATVPNQQPNVANAPTETDAPDGSDDPAAYAVDLGDERILFGIDQADVQQYLAAEEWTVLLTPDYEPETGDAPVEVVPDDAITMTPDSPAATDTPTDD